MLLCLIQRGGRLRATPHRSQTCALSEAHKGHNADFIARQTGWKRSGNQILSPTTTPCDSAKATDIVSHQTSVVLSDFAGMQVLAGEGAIGRPPLGLARCDRSMDGAFLRAKSSGEDRAYPCCSCALEIGAKRCQ